MKTTLLVTLLIGPAALSAPGAVAQNLDAEMHADGPTVEFRNHHRLRSPQVDELERPARLEIEDTPLLIALQRLHATSGVPLIFSPSFIPSVDVDCDCMELTVGEALARLLQGTGLEVSRNGPQVIVAPRPQTPTPNRFMPGDFTFQVADLRWPTLARSEPTIRPIRLVGTITGRVTNALTQEPIGTVQVHIPELEIGALTSPAGLFTIPNVPAGTHTLVAEVIGFQPARQEVTVIDDSTVVVNFQLVQAAVVLDEVVAVGYGTQSRATVSGSVSTVSAADMEGRAFSTMSDALHGAAQGLNIRLMTSSAGSGQAAHPGTGGLIAGEPHDGRPGAPATIMIRNMGAPLIVIDGVPSDLADFNNLNPADIENISILKDASAAVYGFRAANGVIMINTKQGRPQTAPQVQVDGYYGWQNPSRYIEWPLANAYEYLFARVDSENNLGSPTRLISKEELELYRIEAEGHETHHDHTLLWSNLNAPQWNFNATLSGGSNDGMQYRMSVGRIHQDYNIRDFTWGRTNASINLRAQLTPNLTLGTELRGQQAVRLEPALIGNQNAVETAMLTMDSSWPHEPTWVGPNKDLINYERNRIGRTAGQISRDIAGESRDVRRQGSGNFWAEYRLPFGTTVRATFAIRLSTRDFDLARKAWDAYCHDKDNDTYYVCYNSADRSRQQLKLKTDGVFGNVTASHLFAVGRHSISTVGFWELDGSETWETFLIGQLPTNYTHLMELARTVELGNTWSITRRASMGGRIDYDFDKKYLLTVLARYDGSYLYAPGKRWGLFPAISAGWRLTEENFMRQRFGFLNELKLRASWGQTGQEQGVSPWGYLSGATYGVGNGSVLEAGEYLQGTRPRGIPVTNLTWVTSTSRNLGVDLAVLDGRLSMEFDVFERELSGLPAPRVDVLIPVERGYSLPNENLNKDVTRGFEVLFNWADRIGGLTYSFSPNLTVARWMAKFRYMQRFANSWDEYRNGNVGRWAGTDFGYRVIGQFKSMDEVLNHPVMIDGQGNRLLLPGDLIYEDVNRDGVIDAMDMRPIGYGVNQTPILSFGAASRLTYGNISFTVNMSGGAGFGHQRNWEAKIPLINFNNFGRWALDRWHRVDPYDPQSEWIPGRYPPLRGHEQNPSFNRNDSFWRENVRYVRLRRAELSYSVPDELAAKVKLSRLRVYTNIQNAFSIDNTRHYNMDPELTRDAGYSYPTIRLVSIGFSANVGGGDRSMVAGND